MGRAQHRAWSSAGKRAERAGAAQPGAGEAQGDPIHGHKSLPLVTPSSHLPSSSGRVIFFFHLSDYLYFRVIHSPNIYSALERLKIPGWY